MATTFNFNGRIAVTLQIGGQDITVVGTADLTAAASMTLEYKAPSFDQAFTLGTFEEALGKVVAAMQNVSLPGGAGGSGGPISSANLTAKVNEVKDAVKKLPGFQSILTSVDNASVRLTDLRLDLEAEELTGAATVNDLRGSASVGLALDFRAAPPTIPGIGIAVKTITVFVRLAVNQ